MSCFVMKEENIAALACAVNDVMRGGSRVFGFGLPEPDIMKLAFGDCFGVELAPDGVTEREKDSLAGIYRRLYEVNLAAYMERYGDEAPLEDGYTSHAPELPQPLAEYAIHPKRETRLYLQPEAAHFHLVKLCECYLYQTMEGAICDHIVRKAIEFIRDGLCRAIVHSTAAYDAGPWG